MRSRSYSSQVSFLRALGVFLSLGGVLLAQQYPPDIDLPEGARDVRRSLDKIGGMTVWGITWVVDDPPSDREREEAPKLEIQNIFGSIRISVEDTRELQVRASMESHPVTAEDVAAVRVGRSYQVRAQPEDNWPIDLEIVAPYGLLVQAMTTDGDIQYTGYGMADLQTDFGAVTLTFPAEATNFELLSVEEPDAFEGEAQVRKSPEVWSARDQLPVGRPAYGRLSLVAQRPRGITLHPHPALPEDSPIKEHWHAAEVLQTVFRRSGRSPLRDRDAPKAGPQQQAPSADFSVDVRLVQLDVSVTDEDSRPVPGLGLNDFEVIEEGKPQELTNVSNNESPFNLILLLDCSSSTEQDRAAIVEAARRFIDVAREGDKVAVYALANTHFQVLSRLTHDHAAARASVAGIERFGGATPLYDAVLLSYAEELAQLPRERNALILLTDGLDNEIYGQHNQGNWGPLPEVSRKKAGGGAPSTISFDSLRKASEEMRTLIYPIILDPVASIAKTQPRLYERARKWAGTVVQRSKSLAKATGGRTFQARSLSDLDSVYAQVAQELRSVYTVTYRPLNQEFDGEWRSVRVRIDERGAGVRSRPGYYAY